MQIDAVRTTLMALAAGVTVALRLAACSADVEPEVVPPLERNLVELPLELDWRRGGVEEDTVLFSTWEVRVSGDHAVVLDREGSRVRAFDTETGTLAWSSGRQGSGPLEFTDPLSVFPVAGGWGVWDGGTGRITLLDSDGQFDGDQLVHSDQQPQRICPLADGRWAVSLLSDNASAGILNDNGRVVAQHNLPWPYLATANRLERQADWATDDTGTCVLYLRLSTGFTRFDGDGFGSGHRYVEPGAPPQATEVNSGRMRSTRLGQVTMAAFSGFVHQREVWLLVGGSTNDAGRLIDVHDVDTGEYLRTHRLPFYADGDMARSGARLFFTRSIDGYPVLESYLIPSETDS